LLRHYGTLHKDKCRIFEGKLRVYKLKKLECYLQPQQTLFNVATKTNEAAVRASVIISQVTGKKSIPTLDVIYEECTMKATEIFCAEKRQVFKSISLCAGTCEWHGRRYAVCKNVVAYRIAIDESSDVKDILQLHSFIQVVNNEDFQSFRTCPSERKTSAGENFLNW
jgi:hypothetical protein